jgi:hypothetical protein
VPYLRVLPCIVLPHEQAQHEENKRREREAEEQRRLQVWLMQHKAVYSLPS